MKGYAYKEYDEQGNYIWVIDEVDIDDLLDIDRYDTTLQISCNIFTVSDKSVVTATEGLIDVIKELIQRTMGLRVTTSEMRFRRVFGFDKDIKDIDLCYFIVSPVQDL